MAVHALTPPSRRHRVRRTVYAYLFVAPYVLFLLAFGIGPAVYGLALSLIDTTKTTWRFSGFTNFGTAFSDYRIGASFVHALEYLGIGLPLTAVAVLTLALLLHARPGRLTSAFRTIYYLPGAVTGSAAVLLWIFILTPDYSPFGVVLRAVGLSSRNAVLTTGHFPAIFALMSLFTGAGGTVVILYSALLGISTELYEAAAMDGCNAWQAAIYIKIPLVAKYLVFMLILAFSGGFQIFAEPQLMSQVAPTTTDLGNWSPNELSYNYAFTLGNFGVSAAIALGLIAVGLIGAAVVVFRTNFYRIDV